MAELFSIFVPYIAAGFRVTGLLVSAPIIGTQSVPPRVKAGLALLLTILVTPLAPVTRTTEQLPRLILPEFAIGLMIGFFAQLVFEAVLMAGHIVGVQIGISLVSILDPQTNADTPVISVLHQMFATLIFLKLNGHLLLVQSLARSFEALPASNFHIHAQSIELLVRQFATVWVLGVQLAAPILCVTVCMDLISAFIGKAAPQLPVMLLGASVKSLVGFALLGVTIAFWPASLGDAFMRAISASNHLLITR